MPVAINDLTDGAPAVGTDVVPVARNPTTTRKLSLSAIRDYILGTTAAIGLAITRTWNAAGTTFTGLLIDITDTASSASSMFLILRKNNVTMAKTDKDGFTRALQANVGVYQGSWGNGYMVYVLSEMTENEAPSANKASFGHGLFGGPAGIRFKAAGSLGWSSTSDVAGSPDVLIQRDAANTLALRNGTNAQQYNIYNTYTDGSNYERYSAGWSGNIFNIAAEGAGTGSPYRGWRISGGSNEVIRSSGNGVIVGHNGNDIRFGGGCIEFFTATGTLGTAVSPARGLYVNGATVSLLGLPTTNPNVAGRLWNDAGTLKISAG